MVADALIHPVLDSLLRYWNDKRGAERPMPERKEIDPLEMGARLLPHLLLCDLFDRGNRVRFRV
ncbi:MAG: PAS domain-containing protein, partial [Stellaceae bacterium]